MAPWQYSGAHLLLLTALVSMLVSAVKLHSMVGVLVFGGAVGGGLVVAGFCRANRAAVVVGIVFILLTGAILLGGVAFVALGSDHPNIPVAFEVCDARTDSPIAGARVRIRDLSSWNWKKGVPDSTIPWGEEGTESATDKDGQASVTYQFTASTRKTYFTHSTRVFVNGYIYLTVVAPGYAPVTKPLYEYTGSYVDNNLDGSSLACIRIRLQPTSAKGKGQGGKSLVEIGRSPALHK